MIRTGISSLALVLSLTAAPAFADAPPVAAVTPAPLPTPGEADVFVARAEKELADFSTPAQQAAWINATYITDDTDAIAAKFGAEGTEMQVRLALAAAKYAALPGLSFDTKRKIDLLRSGLTLPAPTTPGAATELSTIVTRMSSGYDMKPDEFAALTDKLWKQVEPLYVALHTYVRWNLNAKYGDAVQPRTGPIRADLLGNMWAQEWGNIYDVVAPKGAGDVGYDTGDLLKAKGYDPIKMFRTGEGFYSSLGFKPLPDTFWARSQITKPLDREVICHASAWDVDSKDDLRIKMCTKVNGDDFVTIHHEMGHNYYQRAYNTQPFLYENGANDGFHEAIGDFVALSITPDYLGKIGLLAPDKVPTPDKDIGLLLKQAMDKVAFLPFGLLIDKWRWGVFSGAIPATGYEKGWNDLRLKYQGIVPPVPRDETRFDPGAKYHVPASVPYTRYFLARLLQFQFYQAACKQSGWKGPLHRCSFYGNKAVGDKLNAMLAMGQSKPWPDALAVFTGSREISGQAMVDYFAPLKTWLDKQNKGKPSGW